MASKKSANKNGMRRVRLGEIFQERREPGIAGLPVMSVTMGDGIVDRESLQRRVISDLRPEQHLLARKGDIAYNMMRMWQGVSGLVPYDCNVSPAYVVLKPLPGINSEFAAYLFKSEATVRTLHRFSQGLTGDRLRLYFDQLKGIPVQIPSEDVQSFSAKVLRSVDDAIASTEEVIEQVRTVKAALLADVMANGMPGRHKRHQPCRWLGRIPKGWQQTTFARISTVVRGSSPRPAGDRRFFFGNFVPWITVFEVTRDESIYLRETREGLTELGASESRMLKRGTLVLTNSGATLGVPKILEIDGCANDGIAAFLNLSPTVSSLFLYYYLSFMTPVFRNVIAPGLGQPNLNTDLIGATPVPLPPKDEQTAIAGCLKSLDDRLESEHAMLNGFNDVKAAATQCLLFGQSSISIHAAKSAAHKGTDAHKRRKE